jgi:hypothetical protein
MAAVERGRRAVVVTARAEGHAARNAVGENRQGGSALASVFRCLVLVARLR